MEILSIPLIVDVGASSSSSPQQQRQKIAVACCVVNDQPVGNPKRKV
jgi:hypothetical protein